MAAIPERLSGRFTKIARSFEKLSDAYIIVAVYVVVGIRRYLDQAHYTISWQT